MEKVPILPEHGEPPEDLDLEEEAEEEYPTAAWLNKSCENRMGNDG